MEQVRGRRIAVGGTKMKPGGINEDGKEIEQDGDVTWSNDDESKGISKTV